MYSSLLISHMIVYWILTLSFGALTFERRENFKTRRPVHDPQ